LTTNLKPDTLTTNQFSCIKLSTIGPNTQLQYSHKGLVIDSCVELL